jgi:hypothetical protein
MLELLILSAADDFLTRFKIPRKTESDLAQLAEHRRHTPGNRL